MQQNRAWNGNMNQLVISILGGYLIVLKEALIGSICLVQV